VDRATAEALTSLFLEVVVAPSFDEAARAVLASKPNLRLVEDPGLAGGAGPSLAADPWGSLRTAGGAILVTALDTAPDDAGTWQVVSRRTPSERERRDLELAWTLVRGVTSNAIVLVRHGMQVGLGSGQTSRVDAARQAVEKARTFFGPDGAKDAVAASDAFFPFADGPQVLLAAGVTAFVQPGGSVRDTEVIAAVDEAGAAMLTTAIRHFRH
jgi:phosphoribosylaminoimidazolecarboxamide formyltransferase/IMP cyclohydrolase